MHLPSKQISYTHLKKKIFLNENIFLYFHKRVKLFRTISILLTSILTLFVFFSAERFLNFLRAYSYFCYFYSSERYFCYFYSSDHIDLTHIEVLCFTFFFYLFYFIFSCFYVFIFLFFFYDSML